MTVPEVLDFAPSIGVLGLLGWLLLHVMRQASGDRGGYMRAVDDLHRRHTVDLSELTARHDEQIGDLRSQLSELRVEIAGLRLQVESERRARWEAEDQLAVSRTVGWNPATPGEGEPK